MLGFSSADLGPREASEAIVAMGSAAGGGSGAATQGCRTWYLGSEPTQLLVVHFTACWWEFAFTGSKYGYDEGAPMVRGGW
eukprot:516017-Prymnesium_polylepis.1